MLPLLALITVSLTIRAQKLPKVQQGGMRAPANIKIDGKPAEWGNFRAYNNATQVFYTMANDDEKVYLALQAENPDVIDQIVAAGVVLSIQQTANKNDKNKISITYPAFDNPNTPILTFNLGARPVGVVIDTTVKARDSLMTRHNHLLSQKLKWIGVKDVKGVDTLISVYNGDGIQATGLFNNKKVFTLEMAIPLKYLNLSITNEAKYTYHLQINGINNVDGGLGIVAVNPEQLQIILASIAPIIGRRTATTDFWGEYILAKK